MSVDDPFSRRGFLTGLIATGFAWAVRPVCAQTLILTDSEGIVTDTVGIPTDNGVLPAFIAHPTQGERWPLVLVVHEIFGVHAHIQDICRRLAKLGYLAIAPGLFFRQGDVASLQEINEILRTVVSKVPDAQVMADLDATVHWAKAHDMAEADKVTLTGFCWGGRIVWLYAAHNPGLKAAAAWYGKLSGPVSDLQPTHPLDLASRLRVPVLGLYGGQDSGIPLPDIEAMRAVLAPGGSGSQIQVYPEAPHAFFADYRPTYRKAAAEDAWQRMLAWFAAHGAS